MRDRVRLYLQVMLVIDLCAYASDVIGAPLRGHRISELDYGTLRWAVTVVLVAGWSVARFARPPRSVLVALEAGLTTALAVVYVHLGLVYAPSSADGASFALPGVILLLVVRSSLVPSPVLRTVAVGLASVGAFVAITWGPLGEMSPTLVEGFAFMGGAFIVATSVTSHVIYGLRRQVRDMTRLGQYTLERKLGEGGMGAVYQASHAMLRRRAAIKVIKAEPSGGVPDERARQRFEREAQVTANLKCPHTVELYDFGLSEEGAFYYVMELLEGVDLETAIERFGPMAPERVVFLLQQVCESLEEAHAAGLVHRDIKPANLFVCRHGIRYDFVKVLDFGLVGLGPQREAPDEKLSAEGFVGGTPAYLAPEMARQDAVDGRADLYSLGCVAYWLLSGRTPFEGRGALATIMAHASEAPPPLSDVTETPVPADLDDLIMRCLEKDPGARPASAAELAGLLATAAPGPAWTQDRARRWWETHRPAALTEPVAVDGGVRVTKAFP